MRRLTLWSAIAVAVWAVGCTQSDKNPDWNPRAEYPPWAYDAPFYYRPTEDLKALETVADNIGVYYTRNEYFFVRHPTGYQVPGVPRVAVWYSRTQGRHWRRWGYFGVEQSHFLCKAEADGRHWIRFVGPDQGICEVPPGQPHRIYVVDTKPPKTALTVTPPAFEDGQKQVPHVYQVGERVVLQWTVTDANLASGTVKLGTCFAKFPHNLVWRRFPQALPATGKMNVDIPPEAVLDGGLRFRIEATDKAGNTSAAFTPILRVRGAIAALSASARLPVAPGETEAKPGWPMPGSFIRGRTSRVLKWMPQAAARYKALKLQFSPNDGRSWRTVASGFRPGQSVKWTVPNVTSKNCRLRIVATVPADKPDGEPRVFMLASSQRFTVDTVVGDSIIPDPDNPILLPTDDE